MIGAAGYAGGELLRILLGHPEVVECTATSRSQAGRALGEVHPGLLAFDGRFTDVSPADAARGRDVVFLALEHGESSRIMGEVLNQNPGLIVDLGADFRVQDLPTYERYYGPHPSPQLIPRFSYGLADVVGDGLRGQRAIAAPGCFATAAELALFPLKGLPGLAPSLFAITGSSGAGVHPKPTTHHPARANNVFAYSALSHRHEAEIGEQWRGWTGNSAAAVRLMAHSGPFVRGIYLTLHARWASDSPCDAADLFHSAFAGRPFIRLLEKPPELTHVIGSNYAHIGVTQGDDGWEAQVSVALDNLIKGAGGQAVQAMNLALGLPEVAGLRIGGMFPC